jgi:serine/threonine-protein kinase
MEWCEGVEVTHALNGGGPFHWAQVRDLLVAVTDVYASLHRRSVVHGDVHPGNVLVESDGRIRLLDFGLARLLDEPPGGTRRGGAPEYFDPAYARAVVDRASPPPATAESEQYALGALCYRLATGQHYLRFEPEATRFYRQVLESPPLSFADQGVDVWPEVESVLVRALAKREDERHESVERMAEALAEVDVDEPRRRSAPRPPTALPSADKLIARVQKMTDPEGELFATGPPAGPRATVMNGAAGIAYYLLRVAELTGAPLALAAADAWAERARVWADQPRGVVDDSVGLSIAVIGTASPYHTGSGIELVRALVGHARGDSWTLRQATRRYIDLVQQLPEAADPTLGATSVLTGYSHLVRCLHQVPDQQQSTEPLLDEVIRHGDAIANQVTRQTVRRPLDDESSTLAYTGAAHGWAGVLYTLMTWWEVTHQAVDHAVATRLEELAARAVGRHGGLAWPMRTKAGTPSFMNSWCHGSPGHVYLWNLAHRSLGTSQYGNIAESAAVAVREEAGPNLTLCCGQAGHVFALLNQYRHSRDGRWLRAAEARVQGAVLRAADAIEGDWSHSLYKGDVGLALAALEVAYPEEARHPVFE